MYNWRIRKKLRLKNFDYSQNGYYFVTICTKNRENFFGEIIDGKMFLNEIWKNVEQNWKNIILHYQNVEIDEFIIMPNHIHWIIIINVGNDYYRSRNIKNYGNENIHSLPNLSNIIKWFKIWCTKNIREKFQNFEFWWQKSFFDVIIRNENQLLKTREYIQNNPLKWEFDVNNPKNKEIVEKLRKEKNKMQETIIIVPKK